MRDVADWEFSDVALVWTDVLDFAWLVQWLDFPTAGGIIKDGIKAKTT